MTLAMVEMVERESRALHLIADTSNAPAEFTVQPSQSCLRRLQVTAEEYNVLYAAATMPEFRTSDQKQAHRALKMQYRGLMTAKVIDQHKTKFDWINATWEFDLTPEGVEFMKTIAYAEAPPSWPKIVYTLSELQKQYGNIVYFSYLQDALFVTNGQELKQKINQHPRLRVEEERADVLMVMIQPDWLTVPLRHFPKELKKVEEGRRRRIKKKIAAGNTSQLEIVS